MFEPVLGAAGLAEVDQRELAWMIFVFLSMPLVAYAVFAIVPWLIVFWRSYHSEASLRYVLIAGLGAIPFALIFGVGLLEWVPHLVDF